jgi:hypothetical protein
MEMADYELSDNQKVFVEDAENAGLEVDHTYSGRFMYGKCCPAVRVDSPHEFQTSAEGVRWDNMGLGFVVYVPR